MQQSFLARYLAALILLFAHAAAAQTRPNPPGWNFGYADAGYGIYTCAPDTQIDTTGKPYQTCLSIYCEAGHGGSIGLRTGFNVFPGAFTAYVSVDGKQGLPLAMTPLSNGILPTATFTPAEATALFRTLSSGTTASIVTSNSGVQPPGLLRFPLQGAAQALGAMNAECLLGQPNGSVVMLTDSDQAPSADATPETDPARFIRTTDVALKDPRAMDLAQALLGAYIAEIEADTGNPVEVLPSLVPFQDGRQLLFVSLCGANFGVTGCETSVYAAAAGATNYTEVVSHAIGGGPYWFDSQSGVDGWPDIMSLPITMNGSYHRAKWKGTSY